jgi:hypothetical protein
MNASMIGKNVFPEPIVASHSQPIPRILAGASERAIQERLMDEDRFNLSVRKFLKEVGVTSQREIEKAVREAQADGRLQGVDRVAARMTLQIAELGLTYVVDGHVDVG